MHTQHGLEVENINIQHHCILHVLHTYNDIIILSNKKSKLTNFNLSSDEIKYVIKQQKSNKEIIVLNQYTRKIIIINPEDKN